MRTFKCVTKAVQLNTVEDVNCDAVFRQLTDYLAVEEQQMIIDFVSHQYKVLFERGLIIND